MKIGAIGAGNVGGTLANCGARRGTTCELEDATRSPRWRLTASSSCSLFPPGAVDSALDAAGSLDGKVLIDATNDLAG